MQTYHELKSIFTSGDNLETLKGWERLKPLWACLHAEDQVTGRELLWKLSLDADIPQQIAFICEVYLGYMGDSRVIGRLKFHCLNPASIEYWGCVIALANLNDLEALRLLRDKLSNSTDEHEKDNLVFCAARNCNQFKGRETRPELINALDQLICHHTPDSQCG